MAAKWESVVFARDGVECSTIASSALWLVPEIENPIDVRIHFMAAKDHPALLSSELTAFRERPVRLRDGVLRDLEQLIFGNAGLAFERAEILLARHVSGLLRRDVLYVYANEAYNASAYVRFTNGEPSDFEVVGWHGTDTYFSSTHRQYEPEWRQQLGVVVGRGFAAAFGVDIRFLDDLFNLFYSREGAVESFQLVKARQVLSPPATL